MKLAHCFLFVVVLLGWSGLSCAETMLPYQYDANGNMVTGEGKYYEYNDANQLVRIRHNDVQGPVIAEYTYNHAGQRVKKVENGITTYYIGKHFEKQVDGDMQTTAKYYFVNSERVARKDTTGKLNYFHSDHLGGASAITDSSGNLVERIKYYPFGEIREGGKERYTYTGKEKDGVTDWYYYEARYYNSGFSHFTQADTIKPNYYDPQDLNRYAYVRNSPINLIDPDGHDWVDSTVNWASKTKVGNWLGDQTLKLMGAGSVENAAPEVQAAYYASLAEGLDHTYSVTKKTTGKAMGAVTSLFTEGPTGTISNIFDMSVILAEETGLISKDSSKRLNHLSDLYGLYSSYTDVKGLGKRYHMSRNGYKNLIKVVGKNNYSKYLNTINKYKLHDKLTIVNGARTSLNSINNMVKSHD